MISVKILGAAKEVAIRLFVKKSNNIVIIHYPLSGGSQWVIPLFLDTAAFLFQPNGKRLFFFPFSGFQLFIY